MDIFDKAEMLKGLKDHPASYSEFFRVPALSAGLYRLEEGAVDPQKPHNEDEIYFVLTGLGKIMVKGELQKVKAGDFIYVKAGEEHRFIEIEETMEILVVFSPAESIG